MQRSSQVVSPLHAGGKREFIFWANKLSIFETGVVDSMEYDRPITSYGALDLPTYFLDVTPFVPLLTDGRAHTFTIDVVSAEQNHTTLQNWFVSGNLQVFTDPSGEPTTGQMLHIDSKPFAETKTEHDLASNGDLTFTVTASRSVHIESEIVSGSGKTSRVAWTQTYEYSSSQQWLNDSLIQVGRYLPQ